MTDRDIVKLLKSKGTVIEVRQRVSESYSKCAFCLKPQDTRALVVYNPNRMFIRVFCNEACFNCWVLNNV